MNKKTLLVASCAMAFSAAAQAGVHNMGGCGLGAMLFKENDKVSQVLAATTNGTFGNQTFGISTGSLGCTKDGMVKLDRERIVFAETNFASLKREMAQGQGKYLNSLASLYGYKTAEQKKAFSGLVQSKYETLIASERTTAAEMLTALDATLKS